MGRMHRVREQHGFIFAKRIQQFLITGDESALLVFIKPARNDLRLVIFKAKTVQQRDQPRAAFIGKAALRLDPSADPARRTRQRRRDPCLQPVLIRAAHPAHTAARLKARQSRLRRKARARRARCASLGSSST
jgi:hypothetical protein